MKKIFMLAMGFVLLFASLAQATVYRGAMDNRTGFTPLPGFTAQSNSWYGAGSTDPGKGMRIEWTVDDESHPGYWTYTYKLTRGTGLNKAFALFDFETAQDFTASDIISYSVDENSTIDGNGLTTMPDPADPNNTVTIASRVSLGGPYNFNVAHDFSNAAVTEADPATALNKYDLSQYSGDPGRDAPGVVGGTASATASVGPVAHPFYGLRWVFPGSGFGSYVACGWQVTLVTDRAPMWGNFFGWGDQTSSSPYWYANLHSNNIDNATRLTAAAASTVDITGAALEQFDNYQGWALVPGPAVSPSMISSISPSEWATGVAVGANVSVTFTRAMDASTITAANFYVKDSSGNPVSGTVSYNSTTRTACFSPSSAYAYGGDYTATLTTGIKDSTGAALEATRTWTFTVTATLDTKPPTVISYTPADGATYVPVNSKIAITFSEAIDPATLSTFCYLSKNGGSYSGVNLSYDPTTHTAVTDVSAVGLYSTVYTVKLVLGQVKDLSGNYLMSSPSWSFTTEPPIIASAEPSSGTTGVSPYSYVRVVFGWDMDPDTVNTSTFTLRKLSGATITGAVVYDTPTRTAVFMPNSALPGGTIYIATLTTGVKLLTGNPALSSNSSWNFTTAAADTVAPTVASTTPSNGAVTSAADTAIKVVFSENINPSTISGATFSVVNGSGQGVAGSVSYDQLFKTATFTPASFLADLESYTVTISTGVTDLAGNAMTAPCVFSFTTPYNPPAVTSTYPADNDVLTTLSGPVSATFSVSMDASTINGSTFVVKDSSGSAVAGTVSYDNATHTASFTPSTPLAVDNTYTATISGDVKSLSGSAMSDAYTWSFSMASQVYKGAVSNKYGDEYDATIEGISNSWAGIYDVNKPRGIKLSWSIAKVGGVWKYSYTFLAALKASDKPVRNFDLQTPYGFEASDLSPGWTMYRPDTGDITANVTGSGSAETITEVSMNLDAVVASKTFSGIRWRFNQDIIGAKVETVMFVLNFTCNRAPAWGNFIAFSDSTSGSGNPMIWNSQFDNTTNASPTGGNNGGWVLVPGNVDASVPTTYPLTLSFAGTGGGSVSGSLSCDSTSACDPVSFDRGSSVTLIATPDGNSLFAGWSGACSNASGDCSITMDAAKSVTATFNEADRVRIGSTPYATLASAFAAAASGTVQARSIEFAESPVVSLPTVFKGGYDTQFTSNSGSYTTLGGTLTVGAGSLTVEGLVIK